MIDYLNYTIKTTNILKRLSRNSIILLPSTFNFDIYFEGSPVFKYNEYEGKLQNKYRISSGGLVHSAGRPSGSLSKLHTLYLPQGGQAASRLIENPVSSVNR